MWTVACFVGFGILMMCTGLYVPSPDQFDCRNADPITGLIEFNCWGHVKCVDGAVVIHECQGGTQLDRATMECVSEGTPGNDCFKVPVCGNDLEGYYPDIDSGCISFYRCDGDRYLGRFICPDSLVFNNVTRTCDYKSNVLPPCGTMRA